MCRAFEYFATTGIVQHPKDKVIFVSYSENVEFMCQFEFASIGWKVNGAGFLHLPGFSSQQTYSNNITTATLTFPALVAYNQTTIICTGRRDGVMIESNEVTLLYQGTLRFVMP